MASITDMTEGKPSKILFKFAIPMLISVIFQQLYNIADSVVVGQFVGADALAAVGASYPITMIFMAVATGSNIGCSVVISQLFGAKQYEKLKTAISTSLISIITLSIFITGLGLWGSGLLMTLLHTPDNIFQDSALYLNIYIGGLIFLFLYNICTGVFTALGDSTTPLWFLIASSIGNIILDILFVVGFKWGVAGVAWATFIAQGIASILAALALVKRTKQIHTEEHYPKFSKEMLGRIAKVAIPSILQQSFISVGNLFIQGLVNSYGSNIIAGYSAAIKLNTFAITSFTTMASSLSSFTAQNIGAKKIQRIKEGFKEALKLMICVVIPFIFLFFCLPKQMIQIFMNATNIEAIKVGETFLRIVAPFYLVIAVKLMADGILRGAGVMWAFMVTTFSDLILRVILAFILAIPFGSTGIWLSWPIGWVIATIISCIFYFKGIWHKKKEMCE